MTHVDLVILDELGNNSYRLKNSTIDQKETKEKKKTKS